MKTDIKENIVDQIKNNLELSKSFRIFVLETH